MHSKSYVPGLFGAACGVMALAIPAGHAQPADNVAAHERVVVYAPYVVTHKVTSPMMSKTSAAGIEVVSASRTVSYADLNLSQAPDENTLEDRVRQAAREACAEIDKTYPTSIYTPIPPKQDCVGNAINQAMVVVKDVENAAGMPNPIPR